MNFNYSVEQPPKDWDKYPKSFLRAAIPIVNSCKAWPDAWHKLAVLGITSLLKSGGCPTIKTFKPTKVNLTTVNYIYEVEANPKLNYFVIISVFDTNGKFITSEPSGKLVNTFTIKSDKKEIGSIKLLVRPVGADQVIDTETVKFTDEQPSLF